MTAPTPRKPKARPADVCRLTLTINGTAYALRRIPADPSIFATAYQLRRSGAEPYTVASTHHGLTCTCGDFTWRRDGLDPAGCKHARALKAVGLL